MKLRFVLIALLTCAGLVAGCSSGSVDDNPPKGSNTASAEPAEDEESEEPKQDDPTFGQAYTWEDGISVTVARPKPYKPTEYSSLTDVKDWPAYVSFEVTVVNSTDKKFDVEMFSTSLQSADKEAEEVFDSEKGLEGSPSTSLLPGRQSKFLIAYGVQNPKDLVMDVNVDYDHDTVTYTN